MKRIYLFSFFFCLNFSSFASLAASQEAASAELEELREEDEQEQEQEESEEEGEHVRFCSRPSCTGEAKEGDTLCIFHRRRLRHQQEQLLLKIIYEDSVGMIPPWLQTPRRPKSGQPRGSRRLSNVLRQALKKQRNKKFI